MNAGQGRWNGSETHLQASRRSTALAFKADACAFPVYGEGRQEPALLNTDAGSGRRGEVVASTGKQDGAAFVLAVAIIGAVVSVMIAVRIEWLNWQAGSYLPRQDYTESGNPKWRLSAATSERVWRMLHRVEGELTAEQFQRMQRETESARRRGRLYSAVETIGLLQYPLAFTLIGVFFGLAIAYRDDRRTVLACACLAMLECVCMAFALHREYWPSLGW